MKTLHGTLLRPRGPEECEITSEAIVRIGDDGTIAEVGTDASGAGDLIGGAGCWILPGFVDAHLHLPQWDRRGLDQVASGDWLNSVAYPAEARFRDPEFAEALAEDCVSGLIARGTTTALAYGSPFGKATERVFQVLQRRGMRAIYGRMLNDMNCPAELCAGADESLEEARELAAKWHGAADGRLGYAFSPRNLLTCSEKLLRGAAALADTAKCYLHTHAGESSAELTEIHDRYPDTIDDIDVFADFGLLTERTVLGHGVFIDPIERRRLAESRTTLVHCPLADLFLEYGLMDYVAYRKANVRLALGSSVGGGPDPFMPHVAAQALQTAKALKVHSVLRRSSPPPKAAEAWWLLTAGGADALSLGDRVGRIESGYEADCLVVRPEAWINELPAESQASALLHTLTPCQIEHVFIAGERVGPQR